MEGIDYIQIKERIRDAGLKAIEELLKIAEKEIVIEDGIDEDDDLTADKLTRAAQAKKICIMDALEIQAKIEQVDADIRASHGDTSQPPVNFVENRAKNK